VARVPFLMEMEMIGEDVRRTVLVVFIYAVQALMPTSIYNPEPSGQVTKPLYSPCLLASWI
jgi:hypothetical protein